MAEISDLAVLLSKNETLIKLLELPKQELENLVKIINTLRGEQDATVEWDEVVKLVDLSNGWANKLLELSEDKLAKLLAEIANHAEIKIATIKNASTSLRSFPGVRWATVAQEFGFSGCFETNKVDRLVIPAYKLPPSIHRNMFKMAWYTEDVHGTRLASRNGVRGMKILDPYLTRIVGLFRGRVIDTYEHQLLETEYVAGGFDHILYSSSIEGILFVIVESKFKRVNEDDAAQLFDILARASEKAPFANPTVYGVFTDSTFFIFYSFNSHTRKFATDSIMTVGSARDMAYPEMVPVANKIFSVLLTAYINGLEATLERCGDGDEKRRIRVDGQADALKIAFECRAELQKPVTTTEELEQNSTLALKLLADSVRCIPRTEEMGHSFYGKEDPTSTEQLRELARRTIDQKCIEIMMKENKSSQTPSSIVARYIR